MRRYCVERPDWINYYFGLSQCASARSLDPSTKVGCFIVDRNYRPLGFGYNSFPYGLQDNLLPLTRPEKYAWMIHAERNAISNCIIKPDNAIAFVTRHCCFDCILHLYGNGVTEVYMNPSKVHSFTEEQEKNFNLFEKMTKEKFTIHRIVPDLSWCEGVL